MRVNPIGGLDQLRGPAIDRFTNLFLELLHVVCHHPILLRVQRNARRMIPFMALTPGGGRPPSTQPPPSPPTNGQHRPTRDRRIPPASRLPSAHRVALGGV